MNEKGIVTAVNQKQGKYGVALGNNNWYNGMGTCPAKKGDEVNVEFVVNGQWKNIKDIQVLSASTGSSVSPSDRPSEIQQMSKLKNLTNARISALTNAVNLAVAEYGKEVNKELVMAYASEFLDFIDE